MCDKISQPACHAGNYNNTLVKHLAHCLTSKKRISQGLFALTFGL
jgi:hypothetical protein